MVNIQYNRGTTRKLINTFVLVFHFVTTIHYRRILFKKTQMKMSCLTTNNTFPNSNDQSLPLATDAATAAADRSMEELIANIISEATTEDKKNCANCSNNVAAFARCLDCRELLCEKCVYTHQLVTHTSLHRISRLTTPVATPSEPLLPQIPLSNACPFCDTQRWAAKFFCQNCVGPACTRCLMRLHNGHDVVYIENAKENAKQTNAKLLQEAQAAMISVKEAITQVRFMTNNVEKRSLQTCKDVRTSVKRCIVALQNREMELLKRVDHTRQTKGKLLLNQLETLRLALSKLAFTVELLTTCANASNAFEIMAGNDRAMNELKHVRALRPVLLPCEDDGIMFIQPENGLLRAIASFGNISIGNSLKTSRNNNTLRALPMREQDIIMNFPIDPIEHLEPQFRNRPVWNTKHVSVQDTGPKPSLMFGMEGSDEGNFCRPWGVACDKNGNIVVVDRSNNRLQVFDGKGHFITKFGCKGSAPGQFERPAGITVNPQGNIVVADKDNHRIQIFTIDGIFVHTFGERGTRNGQFNYPWDVACNYLGQIIVSDTRNHRVQLFTSEGKFVNKYGHENATNMWKHFDSPRGVCFTPRGNILITDFNNHRLVLLDSNLNLIQYLGQEGEGFRQFLRPQGILCDDDGNIIVADSRNNRIQVFGKNGQFLWKVGKIGKGPGEMDRPSGICLNPEGRIIVLDFGNSRVQVF